MNLFSQIVDLAGLTGIESGKPGPDRPGARNPKNPGIDFFQILGEKSSSELPFLFGEESESVGLESSAVFDGALSDKSAESLLQNLPDKQANLISGENENQNGLIDLPKIGLEQVLEIETSRPINYIHKSSNLETVLPPDPHIKVENLNVAQSRLVLSPELKADSLNLNNLNLVSTPIDKDNPNVEMRPIVQVEIDRELIAGRDADLKTAGLLDKVTGLLNVKTVRLEKNSENGQTEKDSVKLALPPKSYIKVSAVGSNTTSDSDANNGQLADTGKNLFSGKAEIISPEIKTGETEEIKLNNFEAAPRADLDKKPFGRVETGQASIHTKLVSDIAPVPANNAEKIVLPEARISTTPVKFVLPVEVIGENTKNNHTVMIRMEPDHLGPVRMTISTYNDILTARLVVDSPLAKATVESNLNNLLEQLNRHGIRVDAFEVSVGGGTVGHEARENRFAKSAWMARQNLKSYEKSCAINGIVVPGTQEHLYIEANGVNCFA